MGVRVAVVRLDEENVLPDAAGLDPCFVAILGAPEPGAGAPVHGSDVEVAAEADDPDRRWVSQRAADPGLTIFAYTAEPNSPSHDALNLLAS